jgi:hypothetical protein
MFASLLKPASRVASAVTIAATSAVTLALLPVTPAAAAQTGAVTRCTTGNPPANCNVANATATPQTVTLKFATTDSFDPSPAPAPTVTLTGPETTAGQPTFTGTNVVAVGNAVTADFVFDPAGLPAAPGDYAVDICTNLSGTGCGSTPLDMDDKSASSDANSQVHVGADVPVVTSATTPRAAQAGLPFSVTGQNFAVGDAVTLVQTDDATKTIAVDFKSNPAPTRNAVQISGVTDAFSQAAAGKSYYVVVTHPGTGQANDPTTTPNATAVDVVAPPTIDLLDNTTVGQGAGTAGHTPRTIVITAMNFPADANTPASAASVTFLPLPGNPTPPALSATVASIAPDGTDATKTDITINVSARRTAATGDSNKQTFVLTDNRSGGTDGSRALTVTPAPNISSVNTTTVGQGGSRDVIFSGNNFVAGTTLTTSTPGVTIVVQNLSGSTQFHATVAAPTAAPGNIQLSVVNPDGGNTDYAKLMSVTPAPEIVSTQPGSVGPGTTTTVTFNGTGFQSGMTLTGPAGITIGSFTPDSSTPTTKGTAAVTVAASQTPGAIDIKTTNPDTGNFTNVGALTIDSFAVTAIASNPASPTNAGGSKPTLTISGGMIPSNATLLLKPTFSIADPNAVPMHTLTATGTVSADQKTWTGTISLSRVAAGRYQVQLVSVGGSGTETGTCVCVFNVGSSGAPSFASTAITPAALAQGVTVPMKIFGNHFNEGASVTFSQSKVKTAGPARFGSSTECGSATQCLVVPVTVAADAPTGTAMNQSDVTVTNHPTSSSDTNTKTCSMCLTLDAAPTISSLSPATLGQGAITTLTITGTNFASGAKVTFGNGLTATGKPTISSTSVTVPVKVAQNATGPIPVTVTNPDFGSATKGLNITTGPLTTSITPHYVPTDFTGTLTLTGAGYHSGASVTFPSGSGVSPTNSATVSSDGKSITVPVKVSRTNAGLVDVSVTNNDDKGFFTCIQCLGVAVAPANPTGLTATRNGTDVTVGWTAVPTGSNGGASITGYTVTVTSPANSGIPAQSTSGTSATFSNLSSTTDYVFKVVATNAANLSSPGTGVSTAGVLAGTKLTLISSAGQVVAGNAVSLGGSLTDGHGGPISGATVTLAALLDGGQSFVVGSTTTTSDGGWIVALHPTHNASYTASYAGDGQFVSATSSPGRVVVAPNVTVAARHRTSHVKALVVTGHVAPNKAGRRVRLTAVKANGVTRTFTTTLSSGSNYRFRIKLGKGAWTLIVGIGSTNGNIAGQSNRLSVKRT